MDLRQPPDLAEPQTALEAEAIKFRAMLSTGRSAVFLQLFDFLVERSVDDRSPKEVEIALGVFGKNGADTTLANSAVRVYVHRLRKRLDDFYGGTTGPRLHIPKGEYRVVLSQGSPPARPVPRSYWALTGERRRGLYVGAALTTFLVGNGIAWLVLAPQAPINSSIVQAHEMAFWRPMSVDTPTTVLVGDSFVLAEVGKQNTIERLVLEPDIQSRADFGGYLTTHPKAFYKLYDFDLHYTPVNTAKAIWQILPTISALDQDKTRPANLISSSRLDAQSLGAADIVYVGPLDQIGMLSVPLLRASSFRFGQGQDGLVDTPSGKHYSNAASPLSDQDFSVDYGYIASLPGPSGKHIFIISGIGDAGVQSMAALVTDPAHINWLARQWGKKDAFEALYEVRSMGTNILDRHLIVARPLRSGHIWNGRQAAN